MSAKWTILGDLDSQHLRLPISALSRCRRLGLSPAETLLLLEIASFATPWTGTIVMAPLSLLARRRGTSAARIRLMLARYVDLGLMTLARPATTRQAARYDLAPLAGRLASVDMSDEFGGAESGDDVQDAPVAVTAQPESVAPATWQPQAAQRPASVPAPTSVQPSPAAYDYAAAATELRAAYPPNPHAYADSELVVDLAQLFPAAQSYYTLLAAAQSYAQSLPSSQDPKYTNGLKAFVRGKYTAHAPESPGAWITTADCSYWSAYDPERFTPGQPVRPRAAAAVTWTAAEQEMRELMRADGLLA